MGFNFNVYSFYYYPQMLSVQTPSCAGMERLGIPARSTLGAPPSTRDDRYVCYAVVNEKYVIKYSLLIFQKSSKNISNTPRSHDLSE